MSTHVEGYQRKALGLVLLSSITTAVTLFGVFRFTAELLSASWIGAWALIQGLLLVARVSDSGAGANISRLIAVRLKNRQVIDLRNLTLASLLIAAIPSILLTSATAPLIGLYVVLRFSADLSRDDLWSLVVLALINAVISATATIFLAVCEGMFQLNYKSSVLIVSNLAGLAACVPLIQLAGPGGVGLVYIVISSTQLLMAAGRVIALANSQPRVELYAVRSNVRVLWRENFHLSGIAFIRLSFEPATKFMLSIFAPLVTIAEFELALRVTTQVRVIFQSALQPLLVVGARTQESEGVQLRRIFMKNDKFLSSLCLGGLLAQVFAAPAVQWLVLGSNGQLFMVLFALLAAGNALNTLGLSGYYWQLSSGSLVPLVKVQSLMAVANVALGAVGVVLDSPIVVVAAYAGAFALGGLVSRTFLQDIPLVTRVAAPSAVLLGGSVASAAVMAMNPESVRLIGILLGCGCLIGGVWGYATFRALRKSKA